MTCVSILTLPRGDAGMVTPRDQARLRITVTPSSRPSMTATIHAGASSICTSEISAAVIRSLSASGSINWPNVVTCFCRRARNPSSQSVRAATLKIAAPTSSLPSNSVHSTTTSSGTRKMRASVRLFGRFIGAGSGASL